MAISSQLVRTSIVMKHRPLNEQRWTRRDAQMHRKLTVDFARFGRLSGAHDGEKPAPATNSHTWPRLLASRIEATLALEPANWLARSADQAGGSNDRHRLDFNEEIRMRQPSHFDSGAGRQSRSEIFHADIDKLEK